MGKPMMLYHSVNSHALKNKNKQALPMYWRANRKAWVTSELFMDRFHNCFIPQVKRYLAGKNLSFKVLLLLDNALGHPTDLNGTHPNIEVMFLPPPTTSHIQLLHQGGNNNFQDILHPAHLIFVIIIIIFLQSYVCCVCLRKNWNGTWCCCCCFSFHGTVWL